MSDPFDLNRFENAQAPFYGQALAEIRAGRKTSHWMWFIFPQIKGLGSSTMSRHFAISGLAEAGAYLGHPVLGRRLVECAEAALDVGERSAHDIFGSPDDMKLQSSATLFARVSPQGSVFHRLLEQFFGGQPDGRTLHLIENHVAAEEQKSTGS